MASNALADCGNIETREFAEYPPNLESVPELLGQGFDAVVIDLDSDRQYALCLVEALCVAPSAAVMVFSEDADAELILRCMRAGAREFFSVPFKRSAILKAVEWVAAQHQPTPALSRSEGRLLVFFGSKGGAGVTTIATNFAVALAEESGHGILLIDLNLRLGDAAITLGMDPPYSVVDALQNATSLDARLFSKFLAHHASGLAVLAAPAELSSTIASDVAIGSMLQIARRQFQYVVIDAGKKIDLKQMHLFEESATAYLVTQAGIPELRNANRLIAQFAAERCPKLEIVINRHQSRSMGITDELLAKALNRQVDWRVPNDYAAVRKMQSTSTPIVHQESNIAGVIRQMACSVCGSSAVDAATKGFSVAGLRFPWKSAARAAERERGKAAADHLHPAPNPLPEPFAR
jgi:pilus assembly protein CpaE